MEVISNFVDQVEAIVWGPLMLALILGTGFYLMARLWLMPLRKLGYGFRMLWAGRSSSGEGDISPFNALMTSLSATIGTGNIVGVATAIYAGGPGALFWMWCTALVGMATKYSEAVCAVHYRETDEAGNHVGGPMYYIKNGLGSRWSKLGTAFAIFGAIAGFGIGNGVQSNSVARELQSSFSIPEWGTGVVLAILVGLVLIGGIRWIAEVAGKLVPIMAILYVAAGLVILAMNVSALPDAFNLVFTCAFTPAAATGGFAGATVMLAIQHGVTRGVFSNEAGLGSAPIAHAAAATDSPVRQGVVAMLGTFIDTIIVCSITGLVILVSGSWTSGEKNFLSSMAFEQAIPGVGGYIVTIGLTLFTFTTILGWSVYGERCVEYLFGYKSIIAFRVLWVLTIPFGAMVPLGLVWAVASILNAFMAIPNLIALLLLSPVIISLTREYFAKSEHSA
ncbi:MAG: sodium:alanine symporter family protein [Gammaproteobacteria bacterium]|nr:sodium:alanine symporter family protein [Gammaproteobacteria bacterium]